ncbi:MAG TPA: lipid A 3-O-deacylase, partial [Sporomusaceae bacterium]|nr:lipid A 3-O-deacylase [Sporomusaceae bacterium]
KINDHSTVNVGYMVMHVSNGLQKDNPSYDAYGLSVGFTSKF